MFTDVDPVEVVLELGAKRIFASALAWPGWSRSARTEEQALTALADYAPRYASVVRAAGLAVPSSSRWRWCATITSGDLS